jgi:cytochrome c-type biogenesis protein CcmE
MKPKHQRLLYVLITLGVLAVALTLVLRALDSQITFFYSPSEIAALSAEERDRSIRLGGLVVEGSTEHEGNTHRFTLTDGGAEMLVVFEGILPALFREGQGIVAEGRVQADGTFAARTVLAKHDENYMPPEVAKKLKEQGHWKDGAPQPEAR